MNVYEPYNEGMVVLECESLRFGYEQAQVGDTADFGARRQAFHDLSVSCVLVKQLQRKDKREKVSI
jgi:hypothetical protein